MVLTDRQRSDLHAGIYEYLCSRPELRPVAETMQQILPDLTERYQSRTNSTNSTSTSTNHSQPPPPSITSTSITTSTITTSTSTTPLLEKKWTAIPRLQKKVLELEKHMAQSAKIHAHRMGMNGNHITTTTVNDGTIGGTNSSSTTVGVSSSSFSSTTRMLPRLPPTHVLSGHSMVITCCTIHPIYTIAMSGSEDGTIKVWDHESGDYIRTLKGHTNTVNAIQCSPKQGHYMVSCSTDLSIKLWDMRTYQCLRTLRGHDHTISSVVFLPHVSSSSSSNNNNHNDNDSNNDNNNNNNNNNDHKKTGTGVDAILAVSQFLLSASRDMTVKCWDVESGFCEYTVSDHTDWVRCLAVRQWDGSIWASAGNDTNIYVYETATKRKIVELRGHEHVIESIAFITEDTVTSTTATTTIRNHHNNNNHHNNHNSSKHTETVRNYLVSGSRDRSVKLWNIADGGTCIATFVAHDNWVRSVLLHPSGWYILSSSDDKTIRIYDIKNQRCLRTLDQAHQHFITCMAIHPTLPILISGSVDQTLRCWTLQ